MLINVFNYYNKQSFLIIDIWSRRFLLLCVCVCVFYLLFFSKVIINKKLVFLFQILYILCTKHKFCTFYINCTHLLNCPAIELTNTIGNVDLSSFENLQLFWASPINNARESTASRVDGRRRLTRWASSSISSSGNLAEFFRVAL